MKSLLSQVKSTERPKVLTPTKAPKITPQEIDLEKALTAGLDSMLDADINERWVKWGGFHPSTTNMCPRLHGYLYRGSIQQQEFDARVQRIFDTGNAMHERFGEYFKRMGILVEQEFPLVSTDPPIEGTCDGIIDWDGRKLLELKSIGDIGFMGRKLHRQPKDEHYRQVQLYMHCLEGIDQAFVVYENKNNQEVLALLVNYNREFTEKLLVKLDKTYKAYQKGNISVRPYKQSGPTCQNCQLRDKCWADSESGIKL